MTSSDKPRVSQPVRLIDGPADGTITPMAPDPVLPDRFQYLGQWYERGSRYQPPGTRKPSDAGWNYHHTPTPTPDPPATVDDTDDPDDADVVADPVEAEEAAVGEQEQSSLF